MSFEIERKFLVSGDGWRDLVTTRIPIRQAYLSSDGKASIRVRIKGEGVATLSIKSRPVDLRRLELESSIPVLEAEALIQLRHGLVIEKVRHVVPWGGLAWEIDVFSGENAGLVIAEIELRDEHQHIGTSNGRVMAYSGLTGQRADYNSALVQHPFAAWPTSRGLLA